MSRWMMSIDEAIAHCHEKALCDGPCARDHAQLAEWLCELKQVRAENAKLRELCAGMWKDIPKTDGCGWDSDANCCTNDGECHGECGWWYRMRELGIEAE